MLTKKAGWLLLKNMDFGLVGFWERKFFFLENDIFLRSKG